RLPLAHSIHVLYPPCARYSLYVCECSTWWRALVFPSFTHFATPSAFAWPNAFCPTHTAGASAQRPMHGARSTRTSGPTSDGSFAMRSSAPAIAHESVSHTRTVTFGGAFSPSFTTSK